MNRSNQLRPLPITEKFLNRPRLAAAGDKARTKRKQCRCQIAIGWLSEKIAAYGRHIAYLRATYGAHYRMKKGELCVICNGGHGHTSTDLETVTDSSDLRQRRVCAANHPALHDPRIDVAHENGATAEIDSVAAQRALRFADGCVFFDDHRH
jgi:hypothetical protein